MRRLHRLVVLLSVAFAALEVWALPGDMAPAASLQSGMQDGHVDHVATEPRVALAHTNLTKRAGRYGLYVDTDTCTGTRLETAEAAITGLRRIAQAGLNALNPQFRDLPTNPARYFFGPRPPARVNRILAGAIQYADGVHEKYPIRITCVDEMSSCKGATVAYTFQKNNRFDTIVVCENLLWLSSVGPVCHPHFATGGLWGMGSASRAQMLLHEFAHAFSEGEISDTALGTRNCGELLRHFNDVFAQSHPTFNADSYAWFASWAFQLGFESIDPDAHCSEKFMQGIEAGAGEYWGVDPSVRGSVPA